MEIPEEKVTKVASDDGESLHLVTEFIDKEFYSTLINRMKLEVKNEIKNVLNANELNLNIPKDMTNDVNNDSLITSLKSEIDFLRKEILSKDKIIELIIKDKPVSNQLKQTNDQSVSSNPILNVTISETNEAEFGNTNDKNNILRSEVKKK